MAIGIKKTGSNEMNRKFIVLLMSLVAIVCNESIAGPLTTPNTFVSGTPAVASEVNENFDAVKAAVDDNDSRITTNSSGISTNSSSIATNASNISENGSAISTNASSISGNAAQISTNAAAISAISGGMNLYANGQKVGAILQFEDYYSNFHVLNTNGYIMEIDMGLNVTSYYSRKVWYELQGCGGKTYSEAPSADYSVYGRVKAGVHGTLLYVPTGATPLFDIPAESFESKSGCSNTATTTLPIVFEAFANDEAITGVPNSGYVGPVSIGP